MTAFDQTPLIIGHRGAAGLVPENTLPSFKRAVELGVHAVELDVHRCEDRLVVIHDGTLERTTDGRGTVVDARLSSLRELDAGNGAGIPILEEVLDALPPEIGVNIELKGQQTAKLLAAGLPRDAARSILVSSFDHRALMDYASVRADYPVAPLFGRWRNDPISIAKDFGDGFVNLGRKLITRERMDRILDAGLKVLVYTVNELEEAKRLFGLGVWGVFTDFPDRISSAAL